jgi:AhpC/TSA family
LLFLSGMLPTEGSEARYIGRIGAELDNLVLFLAGRTEDSADSPVLSALAKRYGEIAETDSEVVVVVAESVAQADEFKRKMHFPVSVLSDTDMQVHNMVGASCAHAVTAAALYITDRFLEVFAVLRTGTADRQPDISDVLSWLTYLDSQCPECTQIECATDD